MDWLATNDKIVFEIEELKEKGLFSDDDLGNLRKGKVKSIGDSVTQVSESSNILISFQDITFLGKSIGVCSERNVICVNDTPIHNKLELKLLPKENEFEKLLTGLVLKIPTESKNYFKIGDIVKFKVNTYSILPNNNLLLSEDKVFMKKA